MWKRNVAVAIFAIGLLLIGFELGQYLVLRGNPRPKPPSPTPAYPGPRPRAEFQTPPRPAAVAPRPAESPDALSEVLDEADPFARASRLATLLPTLGPEAVPEVREALKSRGDELGAVEVTLLVRFWAIHDPGGAAQWAFLLSPVPYRVGATIVSIERWAGVDPVAAKNLVQPMSRIASTNSRAVQTALVRGWLASGVPGLEDYIRNLEVMSPERQRAIRIFAHEAIQRDGPEPIARWAEALPDEDHFFKKEVFRQLGAELARVDPAAAVAWCDAHCDGPFGTSTRSLIAKNWAAQDGLAAMQWVSTAPPGKERDWAAEGAFLGWWETDSKGFIRWASAMGFEGVEPWFQPVLEPYALRLLGWRKPEEAIQWIERITDDAARERAFITFARRWRKQDESAAEAWIEQSPLSEEARARVRLVPKKTSPRKKGGRRRAQRFPDTLGMPYEEEGLPGALETPPEASPAP